MLVLESIVIDRVVLIIAERLTMRSRAHASLSARNGSFISVQMVLLSLYHIAHHDILLSVQIFKLDINLAILGLVNLVSTYTVLVGIEHCNRSLVGGILKQLAGLGIPAHHTGVMINVIVNVIVIFLTVGSNPVSLNRIKVDRAPTITVRRRNHCTLYDIGLLPIGSPRIIHIIIVILIIDRILLGFLVNTKEIGIQADCSHIVDQSFGHGHPSLCPIALARCINLIFRCCWFWNNNIQFPVCTGSKNKD